MAAGEELVWNDEEIKAEQELISTSGDRCGCVGGVMQVFLLLWFCASVGYIALATLSLLRRRWSCVYFLVVSLYGLEKDR